MTNAVFAKGWKWGTCYVYDSSMWGEFVSDDEAKALGDLAVARFEELCAEAGDESIFWQHQTSEVIGEVYGQDTEEHGKFDRTSGVYPNLDDLREQAIDEVFNATCGEETPMSKRVAEALGEAP